MQLEVDYEYEDEQAREYDLSWQAIQKGYIGEAPTYTHFQKVTVIDEYRFIRKNFHPAWVTYVLALRVLTLHNPIKEIKCYRKTIGIRRLTCTANAIGYPEFEDYKSPLLQESPLISVIIPTLNRYSYLKDVLRDLERQTYKNFEVIVVDQSDEFNITFYPNRDLNLKYWYQEEKALWRARNEAIKKCAGDYILLYDDDSRVEPDWIEQHIKTLDFFNADLSSGVSLSVVGGEVPERYSYFCISDQLDTGNVLLKKEVFQEIGLFDKQFEKQRMGDGEFGLRAYLAGFKNISNHRAKRVHLKGETGGLRQMGSWDAFRTQNLFAPRPIPSVLYLFRKYFGNKRSILALLKTTPPSLVPYRYKKNKKMLVVGVIISALLFPIVLLQTAISWRRSTQKLQEGAKIEFLE